MTPEKIAAIDIGTNSTLLVIVRVEGSHLVPVRNETEITRLGQDVGSAGRLRPEAVERTLSVLGRYHQISRQYGVGHVIIGGTSALRDAANGDEFIRQVSEKFSWKVRILGGKDEAALTFLATRHEFYDQSANFFVVDIGGGSTEFMYGTHQDIKLLTSLDIGTVRYTERYIRNDPPGKSEIAAARKEIVSEIERELTGFPEEFIDTTLIGVAGTVTTLLAVQKEMTTYDPRQIHREPLTKAQIDDLLTLFCSMPLEKRKELPGLQPKRADVIIMGTAILQEIMNYYGFRKLLVSDRGVRYGLIYDYLEHRYL